MRSKKSKRQKANGITEGSIFGQLLLFFFPFYSELFFQQLYNTADAVVVGRFVGKQALAAVGGTTSTLDQSDGGLLCGSVQRRYCGHLAVLRCKKADKVHWAVHTLSCFFRS